VGGICGHGWATRGVTAPRGADGRRFTSPQGCPTFKRITALGLAGRRELRGDAKRLVREAGGDSLSLSRGAVPVDDAGTERRLGLVPNG
jgi:hypothetical protein